MKKVIIFDLDDTLYDELSYINSGFSALANYLSEKYNADAANAYEFMKKRLPFGRGTIFDDLLLHLGLYSKKKVRECISAYRLHMPDIRLFPEAARCLDRFPSHPLYIVTDGNKIVQKNKIVALKLFSSVKKVYMTHRYGIINAKPSPYCFCQICALEKIEPFQAVYIGDNPKKDFVGIKTEGFKTIRVLTGQHKDIIVPSAYDADISIKNLDELTEVKFNGFMQI